MKDVVRIRYKRNELGEFISKKFLSHKSLYQIKLKETGNLEIIDLTTGNIVHSTLENNLRTAQRKARLILEELGIELLQEIRHLK